MPATRTMKNSSRLVPKIARNLARSSSGTRGSSASASTRSLKSSHETSRFVYGIWPETGASGTEVIGIVVTLMSPYLHPLPVGLSRRLPLGHGSQDDTLAQATVADRQRQPNQVREFLQNEHSCGQQPHPLGGQVEALGHLGGRRLGKDADPALQRLV